MYLSYAISLFSSSFRPNPKCRRDLSLFFLSFFLFFLFPFYRIIYMISTTTHLRLVTRTLLSSSLSRRVMASSSFYNGIQNGSANGHNNGNRDRNTSNHRTLTALSRWSILGRQLPAVETINTIHVYDFDNTCKTPSIAPCSLLFPCFLSSPRVELDRR